MSDTSRRPTVLMILPALPVGVEWARAGAQTHDVVPVRLDDGRTRSRALDSVPHATVRVYSPRIRPAHLWRVDSRLSGHSLVELVDRLADEGRQVQLVHGHMVAGLGGLPHLRRARGIPYVVSVHSSAFTGRNPEKSLSRHGQARALHVLAAASAVVPVSASLARSIEQAVDPEKVDVIPNPVDVEVFAPTTAQVPGKIVIVARLVPVKRVDLLLDAFAILASVCPNASLEIVGDGPQRDALIQRARQLGIAQRATFHGFVERAILPEITSNGAVFALSSHTENMPVAMIEALACGVPVVGPHVGGIPEIVAAGVGETFESGNVDALAEVLMHWLDPDPASRSLARAAAVKQFSIEAIGERLQHLYVGVTEGSN